MARIVLLFFLVLPTLAAPNVAPLARVTADSEYSADWGAPMVVDGIVPNAASDDRRKAWAVLGETHRQGASLTFEWPEPTRVAEVVYYGRTGNNMDDCFRSVEILADGGQEPVYASSVERVHGPQRFALPEAVSVTRLTLRFTSSFGGPNPGASEVQVFAEPALLADLILTPPYPPMYFEELAREGDEVRIAEALHRQAEAGAISEEQLALAARWLDHPDPFVRGLAEWAIADKVGQDNNAGSVVWDGSESEPWFRAWMAFPAERFVACDQVRHAVVNGLAWSDSALRADIEQLLERGRLTAGLASPSRAAEVGSALAALERTARAAEGADLPTLRRLWLEARAALRPIALARSDADLGPIALSTRFAVHHKPNVCGTHYNWAIKPGGEVLIQEDARRIAARPLLEGRLGPGHVDGFDLSFDAGRIVFGWASQPAWPPRDAAGNPIDLCHVQNNYAFELMKLTEPLHLYEVWTDGSGVEQLTHDGYWSDLEPAYLPDGGIAFSSDRSAHSPSCDGWENDIADLNLYRLSADRRTIRRLANQKDIDRYPRLLDNGLLGYLRWEYSERDFWDIHAFWTVRPDGTAADARFKQHLTYPYSVREVRGVPGSESLVGVAAGHHVNPVGPLVLLSPSEGLNRTEGIRLVAMGSPPQEGPIVGEPIPGGGVRDAKGLYQTPYALSDSCFLASYAFGTRFLRPISNGQEDVLSNGAAVYLVDNLGNKELLYRDRLLSAVSPMPFRPRPTPPALPDATDYRRNWATCVVPDVAEGMEGVAPGEIRAIRILEALPWPLTREEGSRYLGGASFAWQIGQEVVWNPVRVIGTVPVAEDGSACFRVPTVSNASVYFEALDKDGLALQRMRSSVSFQPGETRSCHGCHETRGTTVAPSATAHIARDADWPTPPSWGTGPLGYEALVQPVFDKRCVSCHAGADPAAGLDLAGMKVAWGLDTMCQSYFRIREKGLVSTSTQRWDGAVTQVRQLGAPASRLITHLRDDPEHRALGLAPEEWERLVTWVDANCPYFDTLYNKRPRGGGPPVREAFPWREPWAMPFEIENR